MAISAETSPSNRRAFTLVEMFVAISIIALLVALLLPTLRQARRAAKQARCKSNLHQLSIGFISYATDENGWYPYRYGPWTGVPNNWANTHAYEQKYDDSGMIEPYLPPGSYYTCPFYDRHGWDSLWAGDAYTNGVARGHDKNWGGYYAYGGYRTGSPQRNLVAPDGEMINNPKPREHVPDWSQAMPHRLQDTRHLPIVADELHFHWKGHNWYSDVPQGSFRGYHFQGPKASRGGYISRDRTVLQASRGVLYPIEAEGDGLDSAHNFAYADGSVRGEAQRFKAMGNWLYLKELWVRPAMR